MCITVLIVGVNAIGLVLIQVEIKARLLQSSRCQNDAPDTILEKSAGFLCTAGCPECGSEPSASVSRMF